MLALLTFCWRSVLITIACMQGPDKRRRRNKALDVELALYVRWHSPTNKTKVTRLSLRAVETVDVLQAS